MLSDGRRVLGCIAAPTPTKCSKWDGDVIHSGACRSQPKAAIGYRRSDNKITAVDDGVMVAALGALFAHIDWPPVLER